MKTDGIPPKRSSCSVVEFSPATRDARVRFPASGSKKILFKLLPFVQTRSLLALKKIVSFVSLAGSYFTIKLNVYKYEILVLRTSLLQP